MKYFIKALFCNLGHALLKTMCAIYGTQDVLADAQMIAAQQSARRTGLDAYTYEELAKEIVRRGYEVTLTPRR